MEASRQARDDKVNTKGRRKKETVDGGCGPPAATADVPAVITSIIQERGIIKSLCCVVQDQMECVCAIILAPRLSQTLGLN